MAGRRCSSADDPDCCPLRFCTVRSPHAARLGLGSPLIACTCSPGSCASGLRCRHRLRSGRMLEPAGVLPAMPAQVVLRLERPQAGPGEQDAGRPDVAHRRALGLHRVCSEWFLAGPLWPGRTHCLHGPRQVAGRPPTPVLHPSFRTLRARQARPPPRQPFMPLGPLPWCVRCGNRRPPAGPPCRHPARVGQLPHG